MFFKIAPASSAGAVEYTELLVIDNNTWNHLTVSKRMSFDSF